MNGRWAICLLAVGFASCGPTVQNARTASVMVNGNCSMCEETIEQAVPDDRAAQVDWDSKTRVAVITYDSTRITVNAVLDRIARAGYDNERFTSPDLVYESLPHCCRYLRSGTDILPPAPGEGMNEH